MALILYINGQQVELDSSSVIAQTKQINDLNSLDNRQANYTNRFKVPKTARNIKLFQHLSFPGNTSNTPYRKNVCNLYNDAGECFIYKGWANVKQSSDYYDVYVYDGIIDLYKEIENKNLSSLGLTDINHTKNVATVIASWNNNLNYRYILADYNGNTGNTATGEVNIDYLVPAVKVSYLWNKIFELYGAGGYGVGYTGSIFLMSNFRNLWMTFPKGFTALDTEQTIFEANVYTYPDTGSWLGKKRFAKFLSTTVNTLESTPQQIHMKVAETGTYRIEVSGLIKSLTYEPIGVNHFVDTTVFIAKNAEAGGEVQPMDSNSIMAFQVDQNTSFSNSKIFELEAHDSVSVVLHLDTEYNFNNSTGYEIRENESNLTVKLVKFNEQVDFEEALTDFSIKDFLSEVVHRFGLTIFKDKYTNVYEFLTLQEILQTGDIVDWSNKFSRALSEDYLYNNYAQRNWFRYNYNDKENTHKDGFIEVDNKNLADSRDVIKSKIYAPEKFTSVYLNSETNIYPLWEKEVDENEAAPIKYKPLDKRYYFLRAEQIESGITVMSNELEETQPATMYYRERFSKLPFQDIVLDYYTPMQQILNKVVLMDVEMNLTEQDIINFDFRKLYYIEQLSSHFLVNKINNYVPGKLTKCELVRVHYSIQITQETSHITITDVQQNNGGFGLEFLILYWTADYVMGDTVVQYSEAGTEDWHDITGTVTSPEVVYINTLPAGAYFFRIYDVTNNIFSPSEPIAVL